MPYWLLITSGEMSPFRPFFSSWHKAEETTEKGAELTKTKPGYLPGQSITLRTVGLGSQVTAITNSALNGSQQ